MSLMSLHNTNQNNNKKRKKHKPKNTILLQEIKKQHKITI